MSKKAPDAIASRRFFFAFRLIEHDVFLKPFTAGSKTLMLSRNMLNGRVTMGEQSPSCKEEQS